MESGSWVKLYNKMTEWEWYDDVNTKVLFIHLLLTVNWQDKEWHGVTVKRGSRVTSCQHLADELHMSVRQVRTALKHLNSTGEVTSKTTNKYTLVTVENYGFYQSKPSETTSKTTSKRQANDKQTTTTTEYIDIQNMQSTEREGKARARFTPPTAAEVSDYCFNNGIMVDAARFCDYYAQQDWRLSNGNKMKDWRAAVRNWARRDSERRPRAPSRRDLFSKIMEEHKDDI